MLLIVAQCLTIEEALASIKGRVILAICAVGVLEALSANGATYAWMRPTQLSIIALFTLEVTVKLIALGRRDYFRDGWNRFDVAVVSVSYITLALGGLIPPATRGYVQLCRLVRVFKLAEQVPSLRAVFGALLHALKNVHHNKLVGQAIERVI